MITGSLHLFSKHLKSDNVHLFTLEMSAAAYPDFDAKCELL
jgi:hypothetical protein